MFKFGDKTTGGEEIFILGEELAKNILLDCKAFLLDSRFVIYKGVDSETELIRCARYSYNLNEFSQVEVSFHTTEGSEGVLACFIP